MQVALRMRLILFVNRRILQLLLQQWTKGSENQRRLSSDFLCLCKKTGTPGNISNPEVKLVSADGTWGAAPWESRSLPRDFSFIKYAATSAAFLFKFLLRPCERL